MVNTFLTSLDYKESTKSLDDSRLGKQRSECKIILNVLQDLYFLKRVLKVQENKKETVNSYIKRIKEAYLNLPYAYKRTGVCYIKVEKNNKEKIKLGYCSHPATRMWFYNRNSLKEYTNAIITEWKSRGKKNNMSLYKIMGFSVKPAWLNEEFVLRHRSNLKRKDKIFYKFNVKDDLEYIWPY